MSPWKVLKFLRPFINHFPEAVYHHQGTNAASWSPIVAATAATGTCVLLNTTQAERNGEQGHLPGGSAVQSSSLPFAIKAAAPAQSVRDLREKNNLVDQLSAQPEIAGPCLLSLPLSLMLGAAAPLDAKTAATLAQALPKNLQGLPAWERSALMRGAALLLGPSLLALRPDLVSSMQNSLLEGCKNRDKSGLSFDDIASQAWALAVICGGLPDDALAAVQSALRAVSSEASEAGLLFLLDAFLLTAAGLRQRSHPSFQSAHAVLSSASPAPWPSKEAIAALAAPANSSLKDAMVKLYNDHVPLEGYFYGGALHTVLHSALVMLHITVSPDASQGTWASTFQCCLPQSCGHLAAAVTGAKGATQSVSRVHKGGARMRRDLQLHWRQDQLVDDRQRAVNDVTHLLGARMGETVQQPADLQIVLPFRKLVIVLEDDASTPAPQQPFTLPIGCATFELLCLEHFSPQIQIARAATAPGLAAAREQALEAGLGWKLVKVPPSQWHSLLPHQDGPSTAVRGRPIMTADAEDVRAARVAQWISDGVRRASK